MNSKYLTSILAFLILFVIGCAQVQEEAPDEETKEEFTDTGVLVIESTPSEAEAHVDGELKGSTPLTLYNFPIGTHNVEIQKAGYIIFKKRVILTVGKIEEIDATLVRIKLEDVVAEEKPEEAAEITPQTPKMFKINLSSFALYYDLDSKIFTELRTEKSDLFSRKYDRYVDFVVMAPAKIRLFNKPMKEVSQADCLNVDSGVAKLYSGQTLCVISGEGATFAISGTWETMPTELELIQLS